MHSEHNISFFQAHNFAINLNELQNTLKAEIFTVQQYNYYNLDIKLK